MAAEANRFFATVVLSALAAKIWLLSWLRSSAIRGSEAKIGEAFRLTLGIDPCSLLSNSGKLSSPLADQLLLSLVEIYRV